jgi:hypothetical protein
VQSLQPQKPTTSIRAIQVTVEKTGAMTVTEVMMGNKDRHFSKKLTGNDRGQLDFGSLHEVYPGHVAVWAFNGEDDERPRDPNIPSWTLPELDFRIWGKCFIYGVRVGVRTSATLDIGDLSGRIVVMMNSRERRSARLLPL